MSVYGPFESMSEMYKQQLGGPDYYSRIKPFTDDLEEEMFFAHEMARRLMDEYGLVLQRGEAVGELVATTDADGTTRILLPRRKLYCAAKVGDRSALVQATRRMMFKMHEDCGSGRVWKLGELPHVVNDDKAIAVVLLSDDDGDPAPHLVLRIFYSHENKRQP